MKRISLSAGGGGEESAQLIDKLFLKYFFNQILDSKEDAAVLSLEGKSAFTTDGYTVSPLEFSGGNIGKLSIAGTINDLAMMGAKAEYLSCAFMIEEGLEWEVLERIVASMANELSICGAKIVCGDTKVVPRRSVDRLFITTSGIGKIYLPNLSSKALEAGDAVLVSGDIGRHGCVIFAEREGLNMGTQFKSDCASLWPVVERLIDASIPIKAMRDATRGGLSAVLNEWAEASDVGIEIEETAIPVSAEVIGMCEMMGFDPYDLANEGTFVLAVPAQAQESALALLKAFSPHAACIGSVTDGKKGRVVLKTPWGSRRYLELPKGELLPRIC